MRTILISLIFCFFQSLYGVVFKDIFSKGEVGDYSVYQNGSSVTILHIHSKELPFITFEEITLPKEVYTNVNGMDLNTYLQKMAPFSTSWTLMEIDTSTLNITSTYCFLRKAHLVLNKEDTLISSLLSLDLSPVADQHLARTGPRAASKVDERPIWIPSMVVDGKKHSPKTVDVYAGRWAKDSSPLSEKGIELYILNHFPFPYWIQVHGDLGSKKMISIDSGHHLVSPITKVPTLPPSFISPLEKWNNDHETFSFLIKGNKNLENYTVYALEVTKEKPKLIHLESTFHTLDTHILKFDIYRNVLSKALTPGKTYRLTLSYDCDGQIHSITSKDIIHWK
jgi:hypothetical protein